MYNIASIVPDADYVKTSVIAVNSSLGDFNSGVVLLVSSSDGSISNFSIPNFSVNPAQAKFILPEFIGSSNSKFLNFNISGSLGTSPLFSVERIPTGAKIIFISETEFYAGPTFDAYLSGDFNGDKINIDFDMDAVGGITANVVSESLTRINFNITAADLSVVSFRTIKVRVAKDIFISSYVFINAYQVIPDPAVRLFPVPQSAPAVGQPIPLPEDLSIDRDLEIARFSQNLPLELSPITRLARGKMSVSRYIKDIFLNFFRNFYSFQPDYTLCFEPRYKKSDPVIMDLAKSNIFVTDKYSRNLVANNKKPMIVVDRRGVNFGHVSINQFNSMNLSTGTKFYNDILIGRVIIHCLSRDPEEADILGSRNLIAIQSFKEHLWEKGIFHFDGVDLDVEQPYELDSDYEIVDVPVNITFQMNITWRVNVDDKKFPMFNIFDLCVFTGDKFVSVTQNGPPVDIATAVGASAPFVEDALDSLPKI